MAVPLLSAVASPKHLIADKAYDADSLRNWLKTHWRRQATRYDRLARNYMAALALVAVVTEWI